MNLKNISLLLSRILLFFSAICLAPMLTALIYKEDWEIFLSFLVTLLLTLLLAAGTFFYSKTEEKENRLHATEGIVVCAMAWILCSFFAALPFVLTGYIPHFIDAFFEMSSGFTTTGLSIIQELDTLPKAFKLWRSLSHFVGGMGILVLLFALSPKSSVDASAVHVLKAEMPGPIFGKLLPKTRDFSRILYVMYIAITLMLILLYGLGGMNLFDAICTAFSTAGTGGFSNYSEGIRYFNSAYIEYVTAIAMIIYGINFNLFYFLLLKQWKSFFKDEELKFYLGMIFTSVALIMLNLYNHLSQIPSVENLFRDALFTVSSISSTTGFATVDFSKWPLFSQMILLLLMFLGGSAGSTAGGFKTLRFLTLWKGLRIYILKSLNPSRKLHLQLNGKAVQKGFLEETQAYFALYIFCFGILVFLNSFTFPNTDFLGLISLVASCFNNIGQSLGAWGPTANFATLPTFNKFILSFTMILGRLELISFILLFTPRTWKRG